MRSFGDPGASGSAMLQVDLTISDIQEMELCPRTRMKHQFCLVPIDDEPVHIKDLAQLGYKDRNAANEGASGTTSNH